MDERPWNLLRHGTVSDLSRDGDRAILVVDAPFARVEVHLAGVREIGYAPKDAPWDAANLEDPAAIVTASPEILRVRYVADFDEMVVGSERGNLILRYASLESHVDGRAITFDALSANARAYWDAWRAAWDPGVVHPLVARIVKGDVRRGDVERLVEAWRIDRTSDLADAIEILDLGTRDETSPTSTLGALAASAASTWKILLDGEGPYDERRAECGRVWETIASGVAALDAAPPDPRIGRGLVTTIEGPGDHWFRVDQVDHVATPITGPFEPDDERPSFADHVFALLRVHADAGTPARLEAKARGLMIEADCNGVAMADALRQIAAELRERPWTDRELPLEAQTALRVFRVDESVSDSV